ncbi:MAG: ABC transporter permease, partial [Limosilactobacillus sp.]
IALWWYAQPAAVATLVFYAFFRERNAVRPIPLTGSDYSLANGAMILGVISGLVLFITTFIVEKIRKTGPTKDFYWRSLPPLAIACGLIMIFSFSAIFWLLGQMFTNASFDLYTTTVFAFVIIAAVNYVMINLAMTLTSGVVTNLLTIMIIGGMLFSMLTNSSRDWWKHNFSFLGTAENSASLQFNVTLIFSGLPMMTLVDYLFVNLQRRYRGRRVLTLRLLLYMLSACIASIGIFPNDPEFHVLHDRVSMWLVYIMLILIVLIRWILPEVTQQFLILSYVMGGLMGLEYIVFKLSDYLSLTAFELLEFGLAFSWLLLLLQNIENLARFGQNLFLVKITPVPDGDK